MEVKGRGQICKIRRQSLELDAWMVEEVKGEGGRGHDEEEHVWGSLNVRYVI